MRRSLVLTWLLAVAGCGGGESGPSCEVAVAQLISVAADDDSAAQLAKKRDLLLKMCKTDLPCDETANLVLGEEAGEGLRAYVLESCKREHVVYPWKKRSRWSAELRACIAKASAQSDAQKCMEAFRRSQAPGQPGSGEKALASFKKFVETMYPGTPFSGGLLAEGESSCRLSADVTKSDSVSHPFKGRMTGTAIHDGRSSQVDAVFAVNEFGEWACLETESKTVTSSGESSLSGCSTLKDACEGMSIFGSGQAQGPPNRKAKTTEAVTNVKKLYDGARSYYEEELSARGSLVPIAKQFPTTPAVSTAPSLGACCAAAGKKCAPNPGLWTDASWQALKFSMDDPHYYSYTYIASGTDSTAHFTVRANGDLDCDGVYSTFEMVGSVQTDGTVTGQAGFFKDQELE